MNIEFTKAFPRNGDALPSRAGYAWIAAARRGQQAFLRAAA